MSAPIRVAIVHYHLKRGGVTRVIESTLAGFDCLSNAPQCVVLAGEVPSDCSFKHRARVVDGLHYSNAQSSTPDSKTLLERMRAAAEEALGGAPDIWHIHNHALGKNSAMPGLIGALAQSGEPALLHMHDFAEDGRPANYRLNREQAASARQLYPETESVHYGVLNARDHAIIQETGLPSDHLHLLANPVEAGQAQGQPDAKPVLNALGGERLLLYPVRAVRRKNFGEMLLWSALADAGQVFATTLGPTNKNYQAAYTRWIRFATQHQLPVHFGIGEKYDWSFAQIMHAADAILSTSIAEGFGLAFLEPWLFGKTIIGRELPAITADFKAKGIRLDGLYESIPIPRDWIDLKALESALYSGLTEVYAAYDRPLPGDAVERALADISPSVGTIDFAGLNEPLQEAVIERVIEDSASRDALPALSAPTSQEHIQSNADIIGQSYGLKQYAKNLAQIYASIDNTAGSPRYIDPARVLDGFLQPERFRLLRT